MPLRHRHGYAADFHRDLRHKRPKPAPKFPNPPTSANGYAPQSSPYPPDLSWRET
jgi:hypothetical protein